MSQISLLVGKIQGISSMRGLSATSTAEKRGLSQSLTDQFPTHLNREFFWPLQGIKSDHQGTFRADQGSPLWRALWSGFPGPRLSAKSASEFADHIAGCHYPRGRWIRARRSQVERGSPQETVWVAGNSKWL